MLKILGTTIQKFIHMGDQGPVMCVSIPQTATWCCNPGGTVLNILCSD